MNEKDIYKRLISFLKVKTRKMKDEKFDSQNQEDIDEIISEHPILAHYQDGNSAALVIEVNNKQFADRPVSKRLLQRHYLCHFEEDEETKEINSFYTECSRVNPRDLNDLVRVSVDFGFEQAKEFEEFAIEQARKEGYREFY